VAPNRGTVTLMSFTQMSLRANVTKPASLGLTLVGLNSIGLLLILPPNIKLGWK
jgi:hypothetical protein